MLRPLAHQETLTVVTGARRCFSGLPRAGILCWTAAVCFECILSVKRKGWQRLSSSYNQSNPCQSAKAGIASRTGIASKICMAISRAFALDISCPADSLKYTQK